MSFIDFLVKYYVWIIVVLVILIITIIGFLADKKMKNKKNNNKENDEKMMNNEINEPTSLQPQNIINGNDKKSAGSIYITDEIISEFKEMLGDKIKIR